MLEEVFKYYWRLKILIYWKFYIIENWKLKIEDWRLKIAFLEQREQGASLLAPCRVATNLLFLGLMLNEPRRGDQITGRRWSAKHGTPAKSMVGTTTPKGWQNDNFIHVVLLLCHPFGVVGFISSSSRGYASLHHLPVVVPALRASLLNQLPYKINPNFARLFTSKT